MGETVLPNSLQPDALASVVTDDELNEKCKQYAERVTHKVTCDPMEAAHDFAQGAYWMRRQLAERGATVQSKDSPSEQRKGDKLINALYADASELESLDVTAVSDTVALMRAAADRLAFLERAEQASREQYVHCGAVYREKSLPEEPVVYTCVLEAAHLHLHVDKRGVSWR